MPKASVLPLQKTTPVENFILFAIVVKLLQSKSTKSANLSARFSESWGTADPPNWGPPFGLNSLPWGPHSLKIQKKKISRLQPSRGQCLFIHWLLAWDGCVSAFSSLCAAISAFFHIPGCAATSVRSLAAASCVSFLPLSGFISEAVSWQLCCYQHQPWIHHNKACLAHSFPPS